MFIKLTLLTKLVTDRTRSEITNVTELFLKGEVEWLKNVTRPLKDHGKLDQKLESYIYRWGLLMSRPDYGKNLLL